jgi:putative ABC transport system permease protein
MRRVQLTRLPRGLRGLRMLAPSIRALLAHRTRSLLAVMGVAVGVGAVLLVSAVGEGAQAELAAGFASQGVHLLVVRPVQARRLAARQEVRGRVATLLPEDAEALSALPSVAGVSPAVDGSFRVRALGRSTRALVVGTSPSFPRVRGFRVGRGGFFTEEQDGAAERVAVLGARVAATLFPEGDAEGQAVRIGSVPFAVVGALEPQGVTADGADVDAQVYVPLRTALRRLFNVRALGTTFVRVREGVPLPRVEAAIGSLLRERHRLEERGRPDDFAVQDPARALTAKQQVVRAVTLFTAGLAAISLLVGGTGILALMLLSVRERTPEIGLRRALGARPRDVLAQFLAEAVMLSAAGGLLGVGLGALGAWAAAAAAGWPARLPVGAALTGLGLATALGILSGAWPARMAARLAPVVALSRS